MVELLNDRYEIGEVLGTGGMGRVFRAYDRRLDRDVAVKILRGDQLANETARARLRAEAQIAGSLHHRGIAEIFDHDEDTASAERDPFIVMQYIDGTPLSQLIRDRGLLTSEEVAALVLGVAEALDVAHDRGIVHRDLKPSNIVVTPDGSPVVVDFGIAASPTREPLTATGSILGTAEYLSPEQAHGQLATPASDVYALGLVAYSSLTGTSAFRRDNHVASALAQINDALPPLADGVPSGLARLVVAMTSKDPAERPTAREVADTLGGQGATVSLPQGPATVAAGATAVLPAMTPPTAAMPIPATPRRRAPRTAYAALGGLVIVAAVVALLLRGPSEATVPSVVGDTATQAQKKLDRADLDARRTTIDHPTAAAGTVVRQSPGDGKTVDSGSTVTLTVASGRMELAASAIRGKTLDTARTRLEKLGFVVALREVTSTQTAGTIVALNRSGRLPIGSTITLSVAKAAPTPVAVQQTTPQGPGPGAGNNGKTKGKKKGKP